MIWLRVAALGIVICAASCGASRRTVAHGPNRWRTRSWQERHALMTWTLLPAMARAIHRFERTPYPRLACVTCHGRDAEEVSYRMPRALPALDPANMPDEDDDTVRFMREVVRPLADRLMEAGGTVTCFSCHPSARTVGVTRR